MVTALQSRARGAPRGRLHVRAATGELGFQDGDIGNWGQEEGRGQGWKDMKRAVGTS